MSAFRVDTDKAALDVTLIHRVLASSYWSEQIPRRVVERAIEGSLCFGGYLEGYGQIAFGRAVTDGATFAYIADVFVLPEHRGQGYGKRLVAQIMAHPHLQSLRRLLLATRDAHALYAQFGFAPLAAPERMMEIHTPTLYKNALPMPGEGL